MIGLDSNQSSHSPHLPLSENPGNAESLPSGIGQSAAGNGSAGERQIRGPWSDLGAVLQAASRPWVTQRLALWAGRAAILQTDHS
jgi:hypothetical protein